MVISTHTNNIFRVSHNTLPHLAVPRPVLHCNTLGQKY